ncbi:MAG: HAD family phosphatase [Firmicutes bacterium]|nr:HAD family phosphatase [Bacillota bacterium]
MTLKDTKLMIFDMDGLLLDTERLIVDAWDKLAQEEGLDRGQIRRTCIACIGINLQAVEQVVREMLGEDFPYWTYRAEIHRRITEELKGGPMPVKKGAFELLEYLKRTGMPAVVASSSPKAVVEVELKDAGLLPYFENISGGEDAARSKPAPDLFLKAAASIDVPPENCLVLEDSYNGIRAAHAAGMMSVMVPDLLPPTEEMAQLYTALAPDLGAVAEMLLETFLNYS